MIETQGETDCHASDIGHWLAMTDPESFCLGRALGERPYGVGGQWLFLRSKR